MKTVEKRVSEWYDGNVDSKELDNKVRATLDYLKRTDEPEDGMWTVWAYEVTSGAHGQFKLGIFLDEVLGTNEYSDSLIDVDFFENVGARLADVFNFYTGLAGEFYFNENEADGSIGLFYTERA